MTSSLFAELLKHYPQIYLDANLQLKEAVLTKMNPLRSQPGRYRPDDQLMEYLKSL